jgi:hypothetical protein
MATTEHYTRNRFLGGVPFLVRFLTLALLIGGLIGGVTNFLLLAGYWPWEMPPLAHRFLASAAAAYVVGALITLTRRRWAESELLMVTVVIYGILLVGAVLLQPTLLDWSSGITWAFVGIVTPALAISIGYLWSMRDKASAETAQTLSSTLRTYLLIVGILALAVGTLVFVAPKQSGLIWPWAALDVWTLLDSRLIACMLLTIASGAFLARGRNDEGVAQLFLAMLFAYCVVAGIGLALHAAATPAFLVADLVYVGIFAVVVVVGALLYPRGSTSRS